MNVRIVVKRPTPRDARVHPPTGIVWVENGNPVGVAHFETRRNKTSQWERVEVVHEKG